MSDWKTENIRWTARDLIESKFIADENEWLEFSESVHEFVQHYFEEKAYGIDWIRVSLDLENSLANASLPEPMEAPDFPHGEEV